MLNEKIQNKIAIVYGRFQPLSKAHYNMISDLIEEYQQVYILPVQGEKAYKSTVAKTEKGKASEVQKKISRNPFPIGLRIDLIKQCFESFPRDHILRAKSGNIDSVIKEIQRMNSSTKDSDFDVWAGPDEYEAYEKQLKYTDANVQVKLYDKNNREEISATKIRQSFLDNDYATYAKLVAPPLSSKDMFESLARKYKKLTHATLDEVLSNIL